MLPLRRIAAGPAEPILTVPYRFVRPVWQLFSYDLSVHTAAFYLFGALWTVAVWGLVGGLITRTAAMHLGREERIGWREGWKHAWRKWGSHLAAPALPLLGAVLIALPMMVLGWIMRLDLGLLLAGALWVPVLLGGLLMLVLLLGLLFGWPLMWGTIAAESSDAFDAISRSYAYTFQRPLQYLGYVLVAALYGLLGWLLVWGASEAVVHLGYWGTEWGAGEMRTADIQRHADIHGAPGQPGVSPWSRRLPEGLDTMAVRGGLTLIGLGVALVRTLASAFAYSYFWCALAAVYLLLRRDADETEMDDVFVDDQAETYGLPPLAKDEAGVPGVPEPAPDAAAATGEDSSPPAT